MHQQSKFSPRDAQGQDLGQFQGLLEKQKSQKKFPHIDSISVTKVKTLLVSKIYKHESKFIILRAFLDFSDFGRWEENG